MAAPTTPSLAFKLETWAIQVLQEHADLASLPILHQEEETDAPNERIVCKATVGERELGGVKPWNVELEITLYTIQKGQSIAEHFARAVDEIFEYPPTVESASDFEYLAMMDEEDEREGRSDSRQRVKTIHFHALEIPLLFVPPSALMFEPADSLMFA